MKINVSISTGELVDKLTILEIKLEKIKDSKKLSNVQKEYDILAEHMKELSNHFENVDLFFNKLKKINLKLWEMEDQVRYFMRENKFDKDFINLAKEIHMTNDLRFEVKNEINKQFKSEIFEQKSYPNF
tara:strand:+ start:2010 stop:2396 length:387 start_codon:yes stop_codon:yes gene_type:complete